MPPTAPGLGRDLLGRPCASIALMNEELCRRTFVVLIVFVERKLPCVGEDRCEASGRRLETGTGEDERFEAEDIEFRVRSGDED